MALKAIGVVGDTSVTPGGPDGPNGSVGVWTPGAVSETSYAELTNHGPEVIHTAECTFSYTGAVSNPGDTTGSSTVTLQAAGTTLTVAGGFVLVDGDTKEDSWGNTLTVHATPPGQAQK